VSVGGATTGGAVVSPLGVLALELLPPPPPPHAERVRAALSKALDVRNLIRMAHFSDHASGRGAS
jgi:hypothetical protein